MAGLCRHRFANLGMQLDRLSVHDADDRVCWIIRSLVNRQHIFHRGENGNVIAGGDLSSRRLEHVF